MNRPPSKMQAASAPGLPLFKNEVLASPCEHQGSFFWLQNTEGEPVVGVFATNHQPQVLPLYFAARKKNPGEHGAWRWGLGMG
jgi:hypothetical protein